MDPWRTPALTSDQSDTWPFNKTLCFLFLRKSHKRFSQLPEIKFCFNLKMRLSGQTLSNAFVISRKTPLTSSTSLSDLYTSWVIAKSWFMQESSGLKAESLGLSKISSFSIKNLNVSLKINFSKNFPQNSSRDTGW